MGKLKKEMGYCDEYVELKKGLEYVDKCFDLWKADPRCHPKGKFGILDAGCHCTAGKVCTVKYNPTTTTTTTTTSDDDEDDDDDDDDITTTTTTKLVDVIYTPDCSTTTTATTTTTTQVEADCEGKAMSPPQKAMCKFLKKNGLPR